jgi:hypothetical protein
LRVAAVGGVEPVTGFVVVMIAGLEVGHGVGEATRSFSNLVAVLHPRGAGRGRHTITCEEPLLREGVANVGSLFMKS